VGAGPPIRSQSVARWVSRPGVDQAKQVARNRSKPAGSALMPRWPPASRCTSRAGQKKPPPGVKKCGEPTTPRAAPSAWSSRTLRLSVRSTATSLLEEQVPQRQAHPFAGGEVHRVGGGGEGERRQRGRRERRFGEALEQRRCDLPADVVDLLGDEVGVERLAVDDLEGPRPHAQGHVVAAEGGTPVHELPQADVGVGAGDVGEDLDRGGTHGGQCLADVPVLQAHQSEGGQAGIDGEEHDGRRHAQRDGRVGRDVLER
jgi:hypothetical protein